MPTVRNCPIRGFPPIATRNLADGADPYHDVHTQSLECRLRLRVTHVFSMQECEAGAEGREQQLVLPAPNEMNGVTC